MLNEAEALSLVGEALRVSKFHPAIVLALVHVFGWTTPSLGKVYSSAFSLRDDKSVVDNDVLSTNILRPVHTSIHLFECFTGRKRLFTTTSIFHSQVATLYNVEGITRMVMPLQFFAWPDRQRAHCNCCWSIK